jgi:hypothetical protein
VDRLRDQTASHGTVILVREMGEQLGSGQPIGQVVGMLAPVDSFRRIKQESPGISEANLRLST